MIVLKILAAPFVVVLTILAAVVSFLFCVAGAVCVVGCVVLTLLAVVLFIGGQTLGGVVFLVLAFLVSPYGIPAIAGWWSGSIPLTMPCGTSSPADTSGQLVPKYPAAAGNSRRLSYGKEVCLRPRHISKSTKSAREKPSPNR